jgi:hypothetical protein
LNKTRQTFIESTGDQVMKYQHRISALVAGSCLALFTTMPLVAQTSAQDTHQHKHDGHAASALSLNQGKQWQTDAPLRQGMQSIKEAVQKAVPAFHQGTLTKPDAEKLASHINAQVEYLVTNCKLQPQADAVLHVFIGDLIAGADELAKQPSSMQGLPRIVGVLQKYPDYFDHPGWKGISHE